MMQITVLLCLDSRLYAQFEPILKYSYVKDDNRSVVHVGTWNVENCWLDK